MNFLLEASVILAMLAINAVFASYEMALAAVSRARIEVLVQARRRGAACAAYMKDRMEGSLAVVQLGITLAGAVAAATGGAAVDESLSPWLAAAFGLRAGLAEFLALLLFVLPLSAVTIVFAELVPKMIGINHAEAVVLALSPGMRTVTRALHPAVVAFESAVKRLMRVGQGRSHGPPQAADGRRGLLELRAAAALARATRIIGPLEERIVVSAAQLSSRTVADAMVPERDITTLCADAHMADALIEAHLHMHTRYPVCTEPGNAQSISGYVTFKDIVTALKIDPGGSGLAGITRPIRRLPADTTLARALTDMIRDRVHIALVTEGSAVRGLIAMEDIVEELVGDIHDEYDRLPGHLTPIGGGWLAGGGVTLESLVGAMGHGAFNGVDGKQSLADWVDRVRTVSPRSGDTFQADGVGILVRKVRRNRVAEAVVQVAPEGTGRAPSAPTVTRPGGPGGARLSPRHPA